MTVGSVIRRANFPPTDGSHRVSRLAARGSDSTLSLEQTQQTFASEINSVLRFHESNAAMLANRRAQLRQNPTGLRIISSVGYNQLLSASMGTPWDRRPTRLSSLEGQDDGRGEPVFRYIAPKTNEGMRRFRDGISFVVMHSFGRGFDISRIKDNNVRSVRIDPATGHNPRRFANGLNTLLNPGALAGSNPHASRAAIHHAVSLRGDLINSVSWDNRCIHGGGGSQRTMPNPAGRGARPRRVPNPVPGPVDNASNDYSIGIEFEEWYLAQRPGVAREIQDHGPFSEEQFTIAAFVLRKLEAYTGQQFRRFLGSEETGLYDQIRARTVGCYCHKDTSTHADPGAEFFLPQGFELNVTDLRTQPALSGRRGAWEERFEIWWSDVPRGTKISAWDRIFSKMERLRSFDVRSEVFNPALGRGPINLGSPSVTGSYTVAAAQASAQNRLSGVDRAQQMQGASRSGLYSAAQGANSAIQTALATQAGRLAAITEGSLRLPVIVNALGFDFSTGLWVNNTTENSRTAEALRRTDTDNEED